MKKTVNCRFAHLFCIALLACFTTATFSGPINIRSYTTKNGLSDNFVNSVVQDSSGYIWIGTNTGLNRFDGTNFKSFFHDQADSSSLPFNHINTVYIDQFNTLWLGSNYGKLASYNFANNNFTHYQLSLPDTNKYADIHFFFEAPNKKLYAKTNQGYFLFHGKSFHKYDNDLHYDDSQTLRHSWNFVCNKTIIHRVNGLFEIDNSNCSGTVEDAIHENMFRDKYGNYWGGSFGNGLIQIAPMNKYLFHYSEKNTPFFTNDILKITEYKNQIWVASIKRGITAYDKHMKQTAYINKSVKDFEIDNDGRIWCVGWDEALFSIDSKTYECRSLKSAFSKESLALNFWSIGICGDTIFCGTFGEGLLLYNKKTGSITSYKNSPQSKLKTQEYIYDICVDRSKKIWIGTGNGLFRYADGKLCRIKIPHKETSSKSSETFISIREQSGSKLCLLTLDGAYSYETETGQAHDFSELIQKQKITPKQFFPDKNGCYWIASFDKLYKISEYRKILDIIKLTDSKQPIDYFFPRATFVSDSSYILLGTQGGIYKLNADSINFDVAPPSLLIERVQFNGKTIEHVNPKFITLNHDQFPLNIKLSSIDFTPVKPVAYQYRTSGSDSAWQKVAGDELSFIQLTDGTHFIEIRNCNKYGNFSKTATRISIQVLPPWWRTGWFRVIIAASIILLMALVFKYRLGLIQRQKRKLEIEVAKQTKRLQNQNSEIQRQKTLLEEQTEELQVNLLELHNQNNSLETLYTELSQKSDALIKKNKELSEANETKNKLFSIIGHDIKNPFTVLIQLTENLKGNTLPSNELKHTHQKLHNIALNIFSITHNLMNWARSQSKTISCSPCNIDINSLLEEETDNRSFEADQKSIRIIKDFKPSLSCFADSDMVRIIIRNLLHNAIKFTPNGGSVFIKSTNDKKNARIEITDTGIGMDAKTLANVFSIKSISSENTGNNKGTGFGLLTVKNLLDLNNGAIKIKSNPNKGSSFIIHLPAIQVRVPQAQNPTKKKSHIVIVEDNDNLREHLAHSLTTFYKVSEFSKPQFFISELETGKLSPDIILSDIAMDKMDGLSLCNYIKSAHQRKIPVIIMTGIDSPEYQQESYATGADSFLKKPFSFETLHSRIENLLSAYTVHYVKTQIKGGDSRTEDEKLVEKLKRTIENNIDNPELTVEMLAENLKVSRIKLYRKTKELTGLSPSEYIQNTRMYAASVLLKTKQYKISEVAYMVGFSDPLYFSKSFSKHFKLSPTEYIENLNTNHQPSEMISKLLE